MKLGRNSEAKPEEKQLSYTLCESAIMIPNDFCAY